MLSRSCERKSPSSLSRHDPDTIPASRWNTPTTPPRRARSVGAREIAPVFETGSFNSSRDARPAEGRLPRSPRHAHNGGHNHTCHNPQPNFSPLAATSPIRLPPSHHYAPPPPPPLTTSTPPAVAALAQPQGSRDLLVARRALRRRRQHTLISSGDFLGVTGANPYTGEPDVITPPTPSDDAIVTTSSSSLLPPPPPPSHVVTGTNTATPGSGGGDGRSNGSNSSGPAGLMLSTTRARQAEPERGQDAGVGLEHGDRDRADRRLRREECGWSSVAEPRRLSPILQSPSGSGKSAVAASGTCAGGVTGCAPTREEHFLGMPAAVPRPASSSRCHSRRCRRRHLGGNTGIMKIMERYAGTTSLKQQYGQASLGTVSGNGRDVTGGLCRLREVMARLSVPPLVLHRKISLQQLGSSHLDHQQVWDLDSLVVVPVDLRQLSEGCRARRTSSDRIPKLHELGLIDLSKGSQPCVADSPRGGSGLKIKGRPREIVHGLGRALQSACTRTTTTTGFGQRHGQPRHRITAHPCGAMRDRGHEAPPDLGASMPKAHSQSTSPPFSTTTLNDVCFTRPVFPGSVQLSVWPNLDGRDPRRATAAAIPKEAERCQGLGSPTLLPPLVLEAGSDTTSSLTDQETTVPVQGHQHSATVGQPATGDENRSPRQRYWRMRETMRKPAPPGETNLDDEADTGASSPTYTRTSICCITEQPRTSRSAIPPRKHGNQTFARGAARTAFVHYVETTTTNTTIVPKPISAPGISCCRRQGRAAEKKAKKPDHIGEAAVREGRLGRDKGEQGREIVKGKDRENREAKSKEEQMEKVADMTNRKKDTSSPEVKYWARHTMLMLARVLSAYWQVVSPVFNGDSELRKRFDKSRATRGDVVVCVLAVLFLLLLLSVGVWSFRGIIWTGRLLLKVGAVLGGCDRAAWLRFPPC
ncbi:hypothetical protein VTG60DRAFT_2011 [Thermothelomyces hinnuleus]